MPVYLEELALSVARCAEVPLADSGVASAEKHPCFQVVRSQDAYAGPFQVPEAWAGNLASAKVVFLSSNPAISAGNPMAKQASKRIAEKYPTTEWDDELIADFMINRFTRGWVENRKHLKVDGSRGSKEPYWGWIERETKSLLGEEIVWHEEAVMTEVVHCKSSSEEGVMRAASHCYSQHMDRILNASSARLVVIVGQKAARTFLAAKPEIAASYPSFGTDGADGLPDPSHNIFSASIGGKPRLVCFLWHRGARGKVNSLRQLYPQDFHRLQNAANSSTCCSEPTPNPAATASTADRAPRRTSLRSAPAWVP